MGWYSSARSKRAALLVLLVGCGSPSAPARPRAVSIAIAGYVERSDTIALSVLRGSTTLPADSVQWSISPGTAAKVLTGQQLQLTDTGSVTVSAKVGDTTATKVLHVSAPPTIVFDMIDVYGSLTRTVFKMALDGVGLTRVASDSSENDQATSSAGTVAYTSYRTGSPSLYTTPLGGGPETSLDSLPYPALESALSFDGSRIAFVTPISGSNRIWTASANGTNATPAMSGDTTGDVDEESPTWSPAGDALVFVTTQYGHVELAELTLASSQETPLGDGTTTDVDPAWSPDGKTLAFSSTRDGDVGIFLRDFASGTVTRLTPKPGNDGEPAWLRDGRIVYTSWINPSAPALVWVDPSHPSVLHPIPTPAGSAPAHPAAAQEP